MKIWIRNCARIYLLILFCILIGSFFLTKSKGVELDTDHILYGPSSLHPLGTDSLGRDLWLRIVQGGQISVCIGLVTTFLAFMIGVSVGAIAGWHEAWVDRLLMRILDIFISIPGFILISMFCIFLQNALSIDDIYLKSFLVLALAISCTHWMGLARVTRGLVMETKRLPYIEASHALGMGPLRIFIVHIFPNISGRIINLAAMQISTNIMYESFMSFIGLGIRSPWTSWGLLVHEGWKTMSSFPHLILYPSLALFLTVWSLNIVAEKNPKI